MAETGLTCNTLESLFINFAQLVRNDTVKMIENSDFYIKVMPKEPWLDGSGYQYTYPIYERSIVTKAVTDSDFFTSFATLNATPDANNNLPDTAACSLTGYNIDSFGVTTKTVSLNKAAINSPDICLDDLKFKWMVQDQIRNITRVMAENTKWVWSNTYQDQYSAACANKVTAGVDDGAASFNGATPPLSALTFGILETVHQNLGYNGGSINPSGTVEDSTPFYTAVGSTYTFNALKKADANNRNDFRYASAGGGDAQDALTSKIGLGGKVYHGFKFAAVQFPPRWNVVVTTYQRQYPYSSSNATIGKKWEVTNAYKTAQYEDTAIWHDDVTKILIPKAGGSFGNATYQQQYSWAGEFSWRNIPGRECNIDGNIGFFRALFAFGRKDLRPDLGYIIRSKNCAIPENLINCPSS